MLTLEDVMALSTIINAKLKLEELQQNWHAAQVTAYTAQQVAIAKVGSGQYVQQPPLPPHPNVSIPELRLLQDSLKWMFEAQSIYCARGQEYAGLTLGEFIAKMRPGVEK